MAKASVEKLNKLHDLLTDYYRERLEAGEEELLSSGELAAINTFLKNNNINAEVAESSPMQDLTAEFRKRIKIEREA